jgi:hypothetical protein
LQVVAGELAAAACLRQARPLSVCVGYFTIGRKLRYTTALVRSLVAMSAIASVVQNNGLPFVFSVSILKLRIDWLLCMYPFGCAITGNIFTKYVMNAMPKKRYVVDRM